MYSLLALLFFSLVSAFPQNSSIKIGSVVKLSNTKTCYQDNGNNLCLKEMKNGRCTLKLEKDGRLKLYGDAAGDATLLWSSTNSKSGKGPFYHRIRDDGLYGIYNEKKQMVWNSNTRYGKAPGASYQLDLYPIDESNSYPFRYTRCRLELKRISPSTKYPQYLWTLDETLLLNEAQCKRLPQCGKSDMSTLPVECSCVCDPNTEYCDYGPTPP